jgi:hypothetical protein
MNLHPSASSAGFRLLGPEIAWDPATIFQHAWRRLRPYRLPPEVRVTWRRAAGMNHSIRLRDGHLQVRLADLLEDAPPAVLESLALILMAKLFGCRPPAPATARYRRHLATPAVQHRMLLARQARGRKRAGPAAGAVYDLEALFTELNLAYFGNRLPRPRLGWSRNHARRTLGHYDAAHHAIVISRVLDDAQVPRYLLEYVLYHEMLHLKHPVAIAGGRRTVHSKAFREEERRFPRYQQARKAMKTLHLMRVDDGSIAG